MRNLNHGPGHVEGHTPLHGRESQRPEIILPICLWLEQKRKKNEIPEKDNWLPSTIFSLALWFFLILTLQQNIKMMTSIQWILIESCNSLTKNTLLFCINISLRVSLARLYPASYEGISLPVKNPFQKGNFYKINT